MRILTTILLLVATTLAGAQPGSPETELEGARVRPLEVPAPGRVGFTRRRADETGMDRANLLSDEAMIDSEVLLDGSGVAAGDLDGDGRVDLYVARLEGPNSLYRNLGGWRFEDVAAAAGVTLEDRMSAGAACADVDADGDLDLLVTSYEHGNKLFINDGDGKFTDETGARGLDDVPGGCTTMTLADTDGDGDLDLYVARYRKRKLRDSGIPMNLRMEEGKLVVPEELAGFLSVVDGKLAAWGEVDLYYENDGAGVFQAVSWEQGRFLDAGGAPLPAPRDWGLSAAFVDANGDGHADLYVCNDFQTPDRFYLGDGRGGFREISVEAFPCSSYSSMGVACGDLDGDEIIDLLVVDMLSRTHELRMTQMSARSPVPISGRSPLRRTETARNTLLAGRGDGSYAEIAVMAGIAASDWTWSALLVDIDLDGLEDVVMGNGHAHDPSDLDSSEALRSRGQLTAEEFRSAMLSYPRLDPPNCAFANLGAMRFEERGATWGFASRSVTHGMALADLDDDGDLDVVANALGSPIEVYENLCDRPRLAVELEGVAANPRGVGARVVLRGADQPQTRLVSAGGAYLSSSQKRVSFAVPTGTDEAGLLLEVWWPDGSLSLVEGVRPGTLVTVLQTGAVSAEDRVRPGSSDAQGELRRLLRSRPAPAQELGALEEMPLFRDESHRLGGHTHRGLPFDDFALQPLLPWRQSTLGPGVAWIDLDGDDRLELVIGGDTGGSLAVLGPDEEGNYGQLPAAPGVLDCSRDVLGLAAWWIDGRAVLVAAASSLEDGDPAMPSALGFAFDRTSGEVVRFGSLPGAPSAVGALAVADLDGDGDLDVFAAGRAVPGRYGASATSRIFRNESGALEVDESSAGLLAGLGMVSGALATDLDGDGDPEIALAREWGGLVVLDRRDGGWLDITEQLGIADDAQGALALAAGDLDADGRIDLVLTGMGLADLDGPGPNRERELHAGLIDRNVTWDVVEATRDTVTGQRLPLRGLRESASVLAGLRDRAGSHAGYARMTLDELHGEGLEGVATSVMRSSEHVVYLNRPGGFERHAFPLEAQRTAATGVVVGDLDGDGDEDIFLSQNFFGVRGDRTRLDAGRGLMLAGRGDGSFVPVHAALSGIEILADMRGAAAADCDGDGRVDIAVAVHGGLTRLLKNQGARPGLRVRLEGSTANPVAIGAVLQLHAGSWASPARELRSGGGALSLDAPEIVMPLPSVTGGAAPTLRVRWPSGRVTSSEIPSGARAISIRPDGEVILRDAR